MAHEPTRTIATGGVAAADRLSGRLLEGRYRIGARIARGGMASVYEAHDVRLDRTVAVKVMHAGLGDSDDDRDFAERFEREARSAARLSHPNVVSVYDQGDDDGTVFLVMELVTGHTLRDSIVKEAPMTPARALAVMEPVLSALAAAHRAGLVHRDVKPENVLIADDGRVKVADFGLAKAVSADTQHTATHGVLIGTVSYLAPELVVDGRSDARADVYAAGVVLYELLTGVKPHDGETPIAVAYKHVHHDVPPPSEREPDLPPYVDALVARATARDRATRPADAGVLLHQVHRVAQALADGVRDDPELTLDLAPTRTAVVDLDTSDLDDLAAVVDTRERWNPDLEPLREHTSTYPPGVTAAPPPAPAAPPSLPVPVAAPARRPRRRKRGIVLLVLALVAALALGGGAFYLGYARYATTPSVVGMPQAEAEEALEDAGFEFEYTDPVYASDVPKGQVVTADPGSGSRILPGETVTLTLSLGKLLVPRLRGLDEDAAQDALRERQLEFGESIGRYSETVPEGTVLTSLPKAGAELGSGDSVDLVVSQGRRPLKVGSWVGQPFDDAQAALSDRGLEPVLADEVYDDEVPKGVVISHDPDGGTLFRGDEVSFVVSLGPELVEVPRVNLSGVDAATQTLEDAGFQVEVEQAETYYGLGFVVRSDPEAGSLAPKGQHDHDLRRLTACRSGFAATGTAWLQSVPWRSTPIGFDTCREHPCRPVADRITNQPAPAPTQRPGHSPGRSCV